MFIAIMVLQIKGTTSPWNVIITYSQLVVNVLMYDIYLSRSISCYIGTKMTVVIITILGITNLDFFRLVIPPLCISPSLKTIDTLFFDYIIALYPILLTIMLFTLIELHDHNCKIVAILSQRLQRIFHTRWDGKQSILSTFATFLLLSYSKLLFVSCNFLFAVQSYMYNSTGDLIPASTVLLHDPNIPYFKSKHILYIFIALSVVTIFILLPPLILLLYPTSLFRRLYSHAMDFNDGIFFTWSWTHSKAGTIWNWRYIWLQATLSTLHTTEGWIGLDGEFLTVLIALCCPQSDSDLKWFITVTSTFYSNLCSWLPSHTKTSGWKTLMNGFWQSLESIAA